MRLICVRILLIKLELSEKLQQNVKIRGRYQHKLIRRHSQLRLRPRNSVDVMQRYPSDTQCTPAKNTVTEAPANKALIVPYGQQVLVDSLPQK